ncbi:hypothetical protein MGALJ_60510 (plasmid) [Mycobacterium gallinarum]|uniref:Uncharacterized protein n=1 Tax=Mycobacterium gallinarum TaxID=39689 RepID=A0A9W4B9I4_9MYCO|nr:hypothetical protein [Mycobacterium gallinarum]BBY96382.1 hypothetical protein MGALJ_60510 [Mycobacterium gallinarum]
MKIVLTVAAGVAVGLTVVVAVLVQILVQLAPLLAVVALAALVLRLVRRRSSGRAFRTEPWAPYPTVPTQAPAAAPVTAALPSAESAPVEELHLRWGTPAVEDLDAIPTIAARGAGTQVRHARAGSRPSRAARGRRP